MLRCNPWEGGHEAVSKLPNIHRNYDPLAHHSSRIFSGRDEHLGQPFHIKVAQAKTSQRGTVSVELPSGSPMDEKTGSAKSFRKQGIAPHRLQPDSAP
jgi:hypothetical protein